MRDAAGLGCGYREVRGLEFLGGPGGGRGVTSRLEAIASVAKERIRRAFGCGERKRVGSMVEGMRDYKA